QCRAITYAVLILIPYRSLSRFNLGLVLILSLHPSQSQSCTKTIVIPFQNQLQSKPSPHPIRLATASLFNSAHEAKAAVKNGETPAERANRSRIHLENRPRE
uniref:Uncharacterized protein n=1 Tax=Scophthalmus maximus TaxID=52904 RepID=A0A8D3BS20_SCOMX